MRKVVFFVGFFLIGSVSIYAADYLYCPKTLSYAHLGDSAEKVQEICGTPITSSKAAPEQKQVTVLRWSYNFQPNSGAKETGFLRQDSVLVVDFSISDRKITAIKVKNQPVQKTYFCNTTIPFKIGDTARLVQSLCHRASKEEFINKKSIDNRVKQVIFTYQPESYGSKAKLYFQNNKLVKIEQL